jgi:hypothetical protein
LFTEHQQTLAEQYPGLFEGVAEEKEVATEDAPVAV